MLRPYYFSGAIIALTAVLAGITTGVGFKLKQGYTHQPQMEFKSEYIVFVSTRDDNHEIYSMKPDGSELRRLTHNPADDYNPSISPDGQKIVFISRRDNNYEIYVMNFDGSDQARITYSADLESFPIWSPDGKRIAFTSTPEGGPPDIYVMNADGTDRINITNNPGYDFAPAWSPDGTRIVFVSSRDDSNIVDPIRRIYVMNADGTNPQRLIDSDSFWPAWSLDGTKIAFISNREFPVDASLDERLKGSGELHIFDLLSQTETVLVTDPVVDGKVVWSPDGQEILFTSYIFAGCHIVIECERGELYRVNVTSLELIQITSEGSFNGNADWRGVIESPSTLTPEVENTVTVEVISTPTIVETVIPTDTQYIEPTETPIPPTATPEVEDTATFEEIFTPTIVETVIPTDTPEIPPTEQP